MPPTIAETFGSGLTVLVPKRLASVLGGVDLVRAQSGVELGCTRSLVDCSS